MYLPAHAHTLIQKNSQSEPWVAQAAQAMSEAANPWRAFTHDQLWELLFSHTIPRSWSVLSNGTCPICKQLVPMYNWVIEPFKNPWKLRCPHCSELFPKNDFEKYYKSGLDQQHIFRYEKADASLLFNTEHPNPADPLHKFCVDDGHGVPLPDGSPFLWRFIGTYLIYGPWKQQVQAGIVKLANAFVVTGNIDDARRAAIMLHRVADLYTHFDHKTQSIVEEIYYTDGFISTWHDACAETREMAIAYDFIKDAIRSDEWLAKFLEEKSRKHALGQKFAPGSVCAHIEDGIFRTAMAQRHKIHTNYPGREVTIMQMLNILGRPEDVREADNMLDEMIRTATAVDGVTGEKGLNGYTGYVLVYLAWHLALCERAKPGALKQLLERHPNLRKTFRFHIDTWCLQQQYYPTAGDAGWFAGKDTRFQPVRFDQSTRGATLEPSAFQFMADLHEATGDEAYAQVIYHENGHKLDNLPFDMLSGDPARYRENLAKTIEKHGQDIKLGNTLKDEWHLAILRSGEREHERAGWMIYDSGGAHGHANALNIGLFAKGLDLMPDMGYPTLQFNNIGVHYTQWYIESWSHNTVVIDGKNQDRIWSFPIGEPARLWADGKKIAAVRATCVDTVLGTEPRINTVVPVPAITLPSVGLYFHSSATASYFRVYTKPMGAPKGESGWTLAFEDRFDRAELGPDWQVIEGEWRIENGKLVGKGHLGCMRSFPGCQRIEFEAVTDAETPCDLSGILSSVPGGPSFRTGAFMGFGSNNNIGSKIVIFNRVAARTDVSHAKITRGKKHHVRCETDNEIWRLIVDGKIAIEYSNTEQAAMERKVALRKGKRYERTFTRIDLSANDSYYFDVFRAMGGRDHAKFQHSHFGQLATQGLSLKPAPDFYDCKFMRHFATDENAKPGWSAQWHARDEYKYLAPGKQVFMRYIDLTTEAQASTCETWCVKGSYNSVDETWVPRVMVRRQNDGSRPLVSTFVSLVEPHEGQSQIASVRRLTLSTQEGAAFGDSDVCLEVTLIDGRRDLLIAMDVENPQENSPVYRAGTVVVQRELGIELSGELAWVRLSKSGKVESMSLSRGAFVRCAGEEMTMPAGKDFIEH